MRSAVRGLSALALGLCLLTPAPLAAQSPEPYPRALAPDGLTPLEGTPWRLVSYRQGDAERRAGPEVAAWLELRGGRLSGSGGCTKLRGRYAVVGAALSIALGKVKTPTCAEQTAIVQRAMVAGLEAAAGHRLDESPDGATELVISDADDVALLRFGRDDGAPLEGNQWLLEAYEIDGVRHAADDLQPAVLSFQARRNRPARRRSNGELVGSTGCNGVLAEYTRQADVLSLGPLRPTDAPCTGQAATQESAVMGVLGAAAVSLELPPDRLILAAVDGDTRLELVSTTPLEGTTWILERLGKAADREAEPASLRLEAGTATVTGPCGVAVGDYLTDGFFLTIRGIERPGEPSCPGDRLERRLVRALEDTVNVDRSRGDLRLQAADGSVVARFAAPGPP